MSSKANKKGGKKDTKKVAKKEIKTEAAKTPVPPASVSSPVVAAEAVASPTGRKGSKSGSKPFASKDTKAANNKNSKNNDKSKNKSNDNNSANTKSKTNIKKGQSKTNVNANKSNKSDKKGVAAGAGASANVASGGSEMKVDIGAEIILPESKDFATEILAMKEFELKEDSNVIELKEQFEVFQKLLKESKKQCLARAKSLISKENEDTESICIDVEALKKMILNIGLPAGEREYNVKVQRRKCLDKTKELLAYENKIIALKKKLESTSKKSVENEILECEKVLLEAEPVLIEAREALKNISKSSLDEIRALPKPNKLLVRTVKACALMVGKKENELEGWPNVKKLLKTTFINTLIKFEARNITNEIRTNLETNYLGKNNDAMPQNEKLTFENVQKANAVAGNMVKWIEAQLRYNEFIPKVEPMQAKLKELKIKLMSVEGITKKYENAIIELENRIELVKKEIRNETKALEKATCELKPKSLVKA